MGYEADGERRMKILSLCEEFRSNNQISNEVFEKYGVKPVSYTHLDVYKRQIYLCIWKYYIV